MSREYLANKSEVYTKTETNAAITSKIAEVVANAPEDFDTLKEISDWITSHKDSAATMNSAIQQNTDYISRNTTAISNLQDQVNNKVDQEINKGLSTNDYTTIEKNKLAGLENYDDTEVKNDIALNLSGIGMSKKNLLKPTYTTNTTTQTGGVTFTVNDDKSVTVSGKNETGNTIFFPITMSLKLPLGVKYKLNGCPSNNKSNDGKTKAYWRVEKTAGIICMCTTDLGNSFTTSSNLNPTYAQICVNSGADFTDSPCTFHPMLRYANITDDTYEPYQDDLQTQINLISPVHNYVYMAQYLHKNLSLDKGYIIRIGNQLHLNFTATCTSAINSWKAILGLPFYIKSPTKARYYIYNTQEDETKITLYIDDNKNEIYTQSNIAVGNKVYIKGLILDIKGEQNFPTDTGWLSIDNPDNKTYTSWSFQYRKVNQQVYIRGNFKLSNSWATAQSKMIIPNSTLPSEFCPSVTELGICWYGEGSSVNDSWSKGRQNITLTCSTTGGIGIVAPTGSTLPNNSFYCFSVNYLI